MKSTFLLFALILLVLLVPGAAAPAPAAPAGSDTRAHWDWAARGLGEPPVRDFPAESVYPWIELREEGGGDSIATVLFVGDVSVGRLADGERQTPPPTALDEVGWLAEADLTVGNLESPLVGPSLPPASDSPYLLAGEPGFADKLRQAGFDLLGLANNHVADFGTEGEQSTRFYLREAGIEPLQAHPVFRRIHGVRLAFLAFNRIGGPGAASVLPEQTMVELVAEARARADAVVVLVHWGQEYTLQPVPAQEKLGRRLLEAGAALVVGHHPHVVQPLTVAERGVIANSLGNFLFDQQQDETARGLALLAQFDSQGLVRVQLLPLAAGQQPQLLEAEEATDLLQRVQPALPRAVFSCSVNGCQPTVTASDDGQGGLFWGGQIDLTGDGRAEVVRRQAEQVVIYEQGKQVWQSPVAWRVADVALGDPNDDGRAELMLAVWKQDPDGYERSHPYLVGYRGGEYQLMWGGRAVVAPLLELEVGDVTGDGAQELLVVEQRNEEQTSLAVWQWHGWGFELLWRGAAGPYHDLRLHAPTTAAMTFSASR